MFLAKLARVHLQLAIHGDAHDYSTEASAYTAQPELHGTTKVPGTTKKRRPAADCVEPTHLLALPS